jgi:hypothetical protein
MKITLKAHIPEHREIAKMFVGQLAEYQLLSVLKGELIGIKTHTLNRFLVDSTLTKQITIDTSEAEMDLRLAIGTEIEFIVTNHTWHSPFGITWDSGSRYFTDNFKEPNHWDTQLSTDYLDRIGVTIEEAGE